jgi:cytochrome c5
MKKLLFAVLMSGSAVALADRPVAEIYPRTCGVCHAAAVAGAPKFGDTAAWKARIDAKGMDALVKSVSTGLNAMPPKGMCMDCTPAEYKALIEYMSKGA